MRTSTNLVIQLIALVAFVALRFSAPGWWLVILVLTFVPLALLLTPLVASAVVLRRRTLSRAETTPFLVAAASMLVAGALVADFGDTDEVMVPVFFGQTARYTDPLVQTLNTIGFVAVAAYVLSIVWLMVALIVTRKRS